MKELYRINIIDFHNLHPRITKRMTDSGNLLFFGIRERATDIELDKQTHEYVFYKKED